MIWYRRVGNTTAPNHQYYGRKYSFQHRACPVPASSVQQVIDYLRDTNTLVDHTMDNNGVSAIATVRKQPGSERLVKIKLWKED